MHRWLKVRKIADYVCDNWQVPDMYHPLLNWSNVQVNLGSAVQETGASSSFQIRGHYFNRARSEFYIFQNSVVGCT